MNNAVIIIGAGGHAKVVIEILRDSNICVDFCIGNPGSPNQCAGIPVVIGDDHLVRLKNAGYSMVFVAIGENKLRHQLAEYAKSLGYELINAISPRAIISPSVNIGVGVAIMSGVIVNAESKIDDGVILNTGCTVDHDCVIDEYVHIGPQSALAGNVRVCRFVFLGIGNVVIPNIVIDESVSIGAGSLIVSDIPKNFKGFGSPVKLLPS